MIDRLEQLRAWYGIDFPDDLFEVWTLACKRRPDNPHAAFDAIGLRLDGVFDVLAGRFDQQPPDGPLWTHAMSYNDPPEFFMIFWGGGDGEHLGLWFDDPSEPPTCVVAYYNNDAYDLEHTPANLWLTLRCRLEWHWVGVEEYIEYDPKDLAWYDEALRQHDELREVLESWLPTEARGRTETGQVYIDRYQIDGGEDEDVIGRPVVAYTWGAECIAASEDLYRDPGADDETIWREVRESTGAARWLAEAEQALRDGYPATALKLGKDVWHLAPKEAEVDACRVIVGAYDALGRSLLGEVLEARKRQRDQWDAER
jgi:hypothetical protein